MNIILLNMRCQYHTCRKKLTSVELIIICKCELVFCVKHRLAEHHECTYDYSKDKIIVVGFKKEKITKI